MNTIQPLIPQKPLKDLVKLAPFTTKQDRIVYLVRHGESESNKSKVPLVSGKSLGTPLTDEGKNQARNLASGLLGKIDPSTSIIIYTSSALRAIQTAQAMCEIFQANHFKCELAKEERPDLCELGQGKWEGKERNEEYQTQLKKWSSLPLVEQLAVPKVEDGESYQAVGERALSVLARIVEESQGQIIFVATHGNTINAIAFQIRRQELADNGDLNNVMVNPANCDMIELHISQDVFRAQAVAQYRFSKS